jgi:SSS family solute:Na+ symporter
VAKFAALNSHKFHMVLPRTDPFLPWTTLLLGLWIPNFYYWGLNQYIMQRTLGSQSLAQGQRGVVFAAFMKLLIPFIIVMPGMAAFNLFSNEMRADAKLNDDRVLQLFAEAKADPGSAKMIFVADEAWQKLHPETAAELTVFNAQVQANAKAQGFTPTEEKIVAYRYDTAFGHLISKVLPAGSGWQGFVLAALLGAVVSTLASMLNAASTIVTMDIYRLHIAPEATQTKLVGVGRILVGVFMVLGCSLAPKLGDPRVGNSIFAIIQEGQAYIYSGILAVFLVGIWVRRAPPITGTVGLLLGPAVFWVIKQVAPGISFVDRASLVFGIVLATMLLITAVKPLPKPVELASAAKIDLKPSRSAKALGVGVVVLTIVLYIIFW